MLYRKLDQYGDRIRGNGIDDFISDSDAVGQAIKSRLLMFFGEWWENIEDGLPFFEELAGSISTAQNKEMAELIIRERISKTEGVDSISSFAFDIKNNVLHVDCTVNTIFGSLVEVVL